MQLEEERRLLSAIGMNGIVAARALFHREPLYDLGDGTGAAAKTDLATGTIVEGRSI